MWDLSSEQVRMRLLSGAQSIDVTFWSCSLSTWRAYRFKSCLEFRLKEGAREVGREEGEGGRGAGRI